MRTRARDEVVLAMVRLRAKGHRCHEIATLYGVTKAYVSQLTKEVMDDDIATCGRGVAANYWKEKT